MHKMVVKVEAGSRGTGGHKAALVQSHSKAYTYAHSYEYSTIIC